MVENNSSDAYETLVEKLGGRFRASVAIQKRVRELVRGASPLVPITPEMNPIEIAILEILEDKVRLVDKLSPGKLSAIKETTVKKETEKVTKKQKKK